MGMASGLTDLDPHTLGRKAQGGDGNVPLSWRKIRQNKRAVLAGGSFWIGFGKELAEPHAGIAHRQLSFIGDDSAQGWTAFEDQDGGAGAKVLELEDIPGSKAPVIAIVGKACSRKVRMLDVDREIAIRRRRAAETPAPRAIGFRNRKIIGRETGPLALERAPILISSPIELHGS